MKKSTSFAAALLLGGILWSAGGHAQTVDLRDAPQVAQVAPTLAADFEVRIQRLERALAEMTGKYEEAVHEISQLRNRMERMNGDVDFRLSQLESGKPGGGASGKPAGGNVSVGRPMPPDSAASAPAESSSSSAGSGTLGTMRPGEKPQQSAAAPPGGDPQRQYEAAFDLLRQADYDQAEKAFKTFLQQNKSSPLAANAQYWLGETFYVRNKYAEAAVAFAEAYQKYPKGSKAPDSLLKLGMSMSQMNKKNEACTAFTQLAKKSPDAPASIKRRAETERKKLNCPG